MNDFNPGPGWTPLVGGVGQLPEGTEYLCTAIRGQSVAQYWVREEPVPPLPTEPYTVIRVRWADDGEADVLVCSGIDWQTLLGGPIYTEGQLRDQITGFVVLSEPRAVTAKAVAAFIRREYDYEQVADDILTEFGVES